MGNTNLGDLVSRDEVKAGLSVGYIWPSLLPCPLQKPAIKCLMPALDSDVFGEVRKQREEKIHSQCGFADGP